MDPWQHTYKDKIITAEAAAKLVKSGNLVRLHIGKAADSNSRMRWRNGMVSYRT